MVYNRDLYGQFQRRSLLGTLSKYKGLIYSDPITSGIAQEKCVFYLIEQEFEKGETQSAKPLQSQHVQLKLTDPNTGQHVQVSQMRVDVEHKIHGCFVNPIGSMNTKAFQQLHKFAIEQLNTNATANPWNCEILQSYHTKLLSQLKFRLLIHTIGM